MKLNERGMKGALGRSSHLVCLCTIYFTGFVRDTVDLQFTVAKRKLFGAELTRSKRVFVGNREFFYLLKPRVKTNTCRRIDRSYPLLFFSTFHAYTGYLKKHGPQTFFSPKYSPFKFQHVFTWTLKNMCTASGTKWPRSPDWNSLDFCRREVIWNQQCNLGQRKPAKNHEYFVQQIRDLKTIKRKSIRTREKRGAAKVQLLRLNLDARSSCAKHD